MSSKSVDTFIVPSQNKINIPNLFCMSLSSFTYYFFKNYSLSHKTRGKNPQKTDNILSGD